ncbi:hypothetical protein LK07_17440 [Streptomyces pluripotens]|uniref:Uncharacterized protein n=2 Tax=Streptomyces pluripotens TaxID=1355015 RepID=A0A221NZT2_9ACTN|nr:hypothetical protein LK06_016285 [Streptomyces pluripotens]ASN25523.1 hypothetical protein LK07_17440 [Streptomyces pluripotens]
MLGNEAPAYDMGLEILGLASVVFPADEGDEASSALPLLWGELTDWVELHPAEAGQAEAYMVDAAREWLLVEGDRAAERRYFDRWLHDVLGFEHRPDEL